ncbi:relaxase/mobilization nuclease domain-containing protein [Brevundimonas sp.]|uniref:relaxase/mobilization nuclease domain-containing protein n=1 Tax=Brevundimonas sp. TaxID=1871086 RepID=UPI0028A22B9D|nr:relaxase/mobilization nuclease domain-containing protein [Brevundimonas sp.]
MSDFRVPVGFEEALRPPVRVRRARLAPAVLRVGRGEGPGETPARLERMARRAPEVMVKVTGRTRDGGHLRNHLDYISRNGAVALEGPDGERLTGRTEVRELAEDWLADLAVTRPRLDAAVSISLVLSMPAGTDPGGVHDAARAFARTLFEDRHPYVLALHTDEPHPHVHLTVQALGRDGARLNPRKADLQLWRETFAGALRARDIEAEATPRRARGVVRKSERLPLRKLRERFEAGRAPPPKTLASAWREAGEAVVEAPPWVAAIRSRQAGIRRRLVAESLRLQRSASEADRRVGVDLERFVRELPAIMTRRDVLARAIEAARDRSGPPRTRER